MAATWIEESLTIRNATERDAPALPRIERSAGAAFRSVAGLEWIADDDVMSEAAQAAWIRSGHVLVAERSRSGPVGFVTAEEVDGVFHVWELAVAAEVQGRGIGTRLMRDLEERAIARGMAALTLTTFRDLPFNERFYERLGFRRLERSELGARLSQVLLSEAEHGLPAERRCAMRKALK